MKSIVKIDPGISTLLDLNGQLLDQGDGYWIKIEAWLVEVSTHIPHGVRYTLTLHEPYGKRILGYDHKHRHIRDKGVPYEFRDAFQLLTDFFQEVDRVLKEIKTP